MTLDPAIQLLAVAYIMLGATALLTVLILAVLLLKRWWKGWNERG
jgi:hypothetical protein